MKLLRGAWTEGLSAIHPLVLVQSPAGSQTPARPGRILRPCSPPAAAKSNRSSYPAIEPGEPTPPTPIPSATRNRIRHELLPQLRTFNPSIDRTLANLAELGPRRRIPLADRARFASSRSFFFLESLVRGGGRAVSTTPGSSSMAIELDRLRGLDPALRRRVLRPLLGSSASGSASTKPRACWPWPDSLPFPLSPPVPGFRPSGKGLPRSAIRP